MKFLISCLTLLALVSCTYKPILDQNEKYLATNREDIDRDINYCSKEADDYLKQYKAQRAAKAAVRQGVVGGAIGAATGAIFGRGIKSIGVGA
jgi:outer membrane lipoprotein SlyB